MRTASNAYGIIQTSAPTAGSNATVKQLLTDEYGRISIVNPRSTVAEWGQGFSVSTNSQTLSGTTEIALFYFQNPNGSGKTAKIFRISYGPTLGNNYVTYRLYIDPTVTANGSTLTPVGNRQTSQNSAVTNSFLIPTVTANGSLIRSDINSGLIGQSIEILFNYGSWLEANHTILVTRQLSANATIGGVTLEWAEQ